MKVADNLDSILSGFHSHSYISGKWEARLISNEHDLFGTCKQLLMLEFESSSNVHIQKAGWAIFFREIF